MMEEKRTNYNVELLLPEFFRKNIAYSGCSILSLTWFIKAIEL